jgi:type I restriction enzyme M protein
VSDAQSKNARAAVVVPNGALFGDGVSARIKEQLLDEFNLHTIVRLPNGVFAPYTSIPTNLLFFERGGPTRDIWFYEQPLPEGRKSYTKTAPIQFEEFAACLRWWDAPEGRQENERTWKVNFRQLRDDARANAAPHWDAAARATAAAQAHAQTARELTQQVSSLKGALFESDPTTQSRLEALIARRQQALDCEREQRETTRDEQAKGDAIYWPIYNLDLKNPHAKQDETHLPPEALAERIWQNEQRIAELMLEIKAMLGQGKGINDQESNDPESNDPESNPKRQVR